MAEHVNAEPKKLITCRGCECLGSDCGCDQMWYLCDHPAGGERIIDHDLRAPEWCPLNVSEPVVP